VEEAEDEEGGDVSPGGECEFSEDCAGFPAYYCSSAGICVAEVDQEDNAVTQSVRDLGDQFNIPVIFFLAVMIGGSWFWILKSDMDTAGKPLLMIVIGLGLTSLSALFGLTGLFWPVIFLLGLIGYGAVAVMKLTGGQ
jgi:hypothetical protein